MLPKLPRSIDLLRPRKILYWVLVEAAVSNQFEKGLDLSLGTIRSQWNLAPGTGYLNNTDFYNTKACSMKCEVDL